MNTISAASSASAAGGYLRERAGPPGAGSRIRRAPPTGAADTLAPPADPHALPASPSSATEPPIRYSISRAVLSLLSRSAASFKQILSSTGDPRAAGGMSGFYVDTYA